MGALFAMVTLILCLMSNTIIRVDSSIVPEYIVWGKGERTQRHTVNPGVSRMRRQARTRHAYPWEMWLRREPLILIRGRDYLCTPEVMRQQIRNAASRYSVTVNTSIEGDTIKVDVCQKDEDSLSD